MNLNSIKYFINSLNESVESQQSSQNDKNKYNELEEVLVNSISGFIASQNQTQLKAIAKGLVSKFAENKKRIKDRYLLTVFGIYAQNKIKPYFQKWKSNQLRKDYDYILDRINESRQTEKKLFSSGGNYNNSYRIPKISIQDNFIDRQEKFSQRKKENKIKKETQKENELQLLYTFSPKVNSSGNFPKKSMDGISNFSPELKSEDKGKKMNAFDRLYRNGVLKYRKNLNNDFKKKGNTSKRGNNQQTYDKLYKDHFDLENRRKNLQKEIDEERGLTFKPQCFTSKSGYCVEGNFDERNKKLIEDRENFVFVYDYLRQCKFNEQVLGHQSNILMKNYLANTKNELENLVQSQRIANQISADDDTLNSPYSE